MTDTDGDVPTLPAASTARAVSPCAPPATVLVSQAMAADDAATEPTSWPSTRSSTRVTDPASEAVMDTATVPASRAPPAGPVTATTGAVVSGATGVALAVADQAEVLPSV